MEAVEFFTMLSTPSSSRLSEKAYRVKQNIVRWPSHIPKGPLFALASALIDEEIPPEEKGFTPFSIRKCLNGSMAERFGENELVMCLPKYGDGNQAGVTAEMIRTRAAGKLAVFWDVDQSEPATKEEVAKFMKDAFGV